jgi:hypothetical protein
MTTPLREDVAGAARLEVVGDEVLDHRDHVPVLDRLDLRHDERGGEVRVLAEGLGDPAARRHPRDVDRGPEQDVVPLAARLLRHRAAVLARERRIERRRERDGGGERGHPVRAADAAAAVRVDERCGREGRRA